MPTHAEVYRDAYRYGVSVTVNTALLNGFIRPALKEALYAELLGYAVKPQPAAGVVEELLRAIYSIGPKMPLPDGSIVHVGRREAEAVLRRVSNRLHAADTSLTTPEALLQAYEAEVASRTCQPPTDEASRATQLAIMTGVLQRLKAAS